MASPSGCNAVGAAASGVALGTQAQAFGSSSVALGAGAVTAHALSVAIGGASVTTVGAQSGYAAFGLAAPQNSIGEVSFGVPDRSASSPTSRRAAATPTR